MSKLTIDLEIPGSGLKTFCQKSEGTLFWNKRQTRDKIWLQILASSHETYQL